jgi:hypothetical protein
MSFDQRLRQPGSLRLLTAGCNGERTQGDTNEKCLAQKHGLVSVNAFAKFLVDDFRRLQSPEWKKANRRMRLLGKKLLRLPPLANSLFRLHQR